MLATRFSARNSTTIKHSNRPLTADEIRSVAPSVFAAAAHESRSARYTYIPTADVLAGLQREGFLPFAATQSRSRVEGKSEFTKHMLRLRHESALARGNEGSVNEIILINSHDGTSSYQMLGGVFRFVCANGLVVADSTIEDVRCKHTGDVIGDVVEGAFRLLAGFERVDASREAMQAVQLSAPQQEAFARAALAMRYPDKQANEIVVRPDQVLRPVRFADRQDDLWTTFNRVQEHVVRGGDRGWQRVERDGRSTVRRATTRAVNGIDGNVALNRGLWVLAEEMRKLVTTGAIAA